LLQANKEKLYTQYKDEGNNLFNRGKYTEAKRKYAAALKQKPGDGYVTAKLEACDQRITEAARERDRLSKQAQKKKIPEGMVKIPAGTFMMGSNNGESDEKPVHKVPVDAFYMDKHEVTVEKYGKFLQAKGHRQPTDWSDQLKQPKHPVVYVSWQDATAYTDWAGKRLPTEAEWEYAARGGNTGVGEKPIYKYPWSNSIDKSKANYGNPYSSDWSKGAGKYLKGVGSYSKNNFGLYNMAGNVREWCSDWYDEDYYKSSSEQNPKGSNTGYLRVVRGGSWYYTEDYLRVANRDLVSPDVRFGSLGFRCVQDVR